MRIGLVSLHTSPLDPPGEGDAGGMNVVVLALANALAARGHDVEMITRWTGDGRPGSVRLGSGVRLTTLAIGEPRLAKTDLPSVVPEFGAALSRLGTFDVLHSHYWLSAVAALPVARDTGAAHVVSLHTVAAVKNSSLAPGDVPEPPTRLSAERAVTTLSDEIIVASEAERRAVVTEYSATPARVHVVAPGVDTALFHPRAGTPPWIAELSSGRPVVTVLGRLQPLKGHELAVRAIAALAPTDRPVLILAGGSSPGHPEYARSVRTIARHCGVHCVMPGPLDRERTAALLAASTLVLVPSYSETFGLVALEAQASGTPVIASHGSGLSDAVVDGVSGVLVHGREPRDWAAAITTLLHDRDARERFGAAGVQHAAGHSWAATAEATERIYDRARRAADGVDEGDRTRAPD